VKKDARGLPETFSKQMLFDYRWLFILIFVVVQVVVCYCSCVLGVFKCACGFGLYFLWAGIKGIIQNSLFNMDPSTFCYLIIHNMFIFTTKAE